MNSQEDIFKTSIKEDCILQQRVHREKRVIIASQNRVQRDCGLPAAARATYPRP